MDEIKKLFEIVDKGIITLDEFRYIANHEFVSEVIYKQPDGKHDDCAKYLVKYINADSDMIYVKQ